jgi:hypothetical protein
MKSDGKMWYLFASRIGSHICAKPFSNIDAHIEGEQKRLWKNTKDRPFNLLYGVIRMVKVRYTFPWSTRTGRIYPGTIL